MKKKKVKIRKSWGILNPRTRVIDSKKKYDRAKAKKELRRDLDD